MDCSHFENDHQLQDDLHFGIFPLGPMCNLCRDFHQQVPDPPTPANTYSVTRGQEESFELFDNCDEQQINGVGSLMCKNCENNVIFSLKHFVSHEGVSTVHTTAGENKEFPDAEVFPCKAASQIPYIIHGMRSDAAISKSVPTNESIVLELGMLLTENQKGPCDPEPIQVEHVKTAIDNFCNDLIQGIENARYNLKRQLSKVVGEGGVGIAGGIPYNLNNEEVLQALQKSTVGGPEIPTDVLVTACSNGCSISWKTSHSNQHRPKAHKFRIQLQNLTSNQSESTEINAAIDISKGNVNNEASAFINAPGYEGCTVLGLVMAIDVLGNCSGWGQSVATHLPEMRRTMLSFVSDFDENGVMYFLGTGRGTTKYSNPCASGLVKVEWSSVANGCEVSHFVCHKAPLAYCYTNEGEGQWMMVDLGEKRMLIPNHYCLRHDYRNGFVLRNWDLQGRVTACKDSEEGWVVLSSHKDDKSLKKMQGATASWEVKVNEAFRFFRIKMTGVNSSQTNYLMCSGIELYGILMEL